MAILAVALVMAGYVALNPRRGSAWPPAALPRGNVLLVTLDTVRADRVRPAPDSRLAPVLGQLMREGRAFTNAYTHAALTLPAHASILTGLLPPAHGVRGNGSFRLSETHVTLAERLGAAGYQTAAFVGAFVLDARFGLQQGFDRYDGVTDERSFAQDFAFAERRADRVLAAAEQWIVSAAAPDSSRPWFAWVHLFDAHAPYDAPASLVPDPYENEIAYVDRELGGLLQRLQARGTLDRTLIVVTSDHGEGLGEHGESTHGLFAYDSTMRVPLVFHAPGIGSGVHDELSTHVDILPTVLDIVGVGIGDGLPGQPLRLAIADPDGSRDAYLEAMDGWLTAGAAPLTALVAGSWKFVEAPDRELYDLTSDPKEERNQFAAQPERANGMARLLRPLAQATSAAPLVRRDEEAEARLRSLGYVSSPASSPATFVAADDPKRVLPLYERFLKVLAAPEAGRVEELLAIVRARPSFVAARLTAASMLINGGQGADAVALLEDARRPDAPLALRERLGAALLAAGRADDAEGVLAEATSHQDASADAWNALGVARAARGKSEEARAAFDRAVTLAPDAARFLFNRALAHLEAGDAANANADLAALTTRHTQFVDGWRVLADTRFRHGDRAGAVEAWQRVVALAPADLDSLFNLSVTLHDLGRTEDARRAAAAFIAQARPEQYRKEIALLEGFGRIKN